MKVFETTGALKAFIVALAIRLLGIDHVGTGLLYWLSPIVCQVLTYHLRQSGSLSHARGYQMC